MQNTAPRSGPVINDRLTVSVHGAPPVWSPRLGGVERYGVFLQGALSARGQLSADGLRFGLRAVPEMAVVRTGDGCSAAWALACGRRGRAVERRVDIEREVYRSVPVIATSARVEDELRAHYGVDARLVLHNPARLEVIDDGPQGDHPKGSRPTIVLVGHGFERRGLGVWLSALRRHPGLRAFETLVIGRDASVWFWRLRAAGLPVRFLGPVDSSPYIAAAALVVHPARYEPYGNVIAEAVSRGIPVVASDACGAAALLHPDHVWPVLAGQDDLSARVVSALSRPRPPVLFPPSAEAHLETLCRFLETLA